MRGWVLLPLLLASCARCDKAPPPAAPPLGVLASEPAPHPDVVDVLEREPRFSKLVAAARATGRIELIRVKGPFTVFAPVNEAFARLPEYIANDPARMLAALQHLVVPSRRIPAAELVRSGPVFDSARGRLTVSEDHGSISIEGARIVTSDMSASNGVIHAVDRFPGLP
jgi:uncharacterized surface protein with fasciclin (FAS1) repeats